MTHPTTGSSSKRQNSHLYLNNEGMKLQNNIIHHVTEYVMT